MGRINRVIEVKNYNPLLHGKNTVIGVLDIYGFEIFDSNRLVEVPRVGPIKVPVLDARTLLSSLQKCLFYPQF